MKDTAYAFCVARLRALEGSLLTKEDVAALINQDDLKAALSFLVQKNYAYENEDISTLIQRHTKQLNDTLYEAVPDKARLDALYILNDYFNLKLIVKSLITKQDPTELYAYPTTIDFYCFNHITDGNFDNLNSEYSLLLNQAYSLAVKSENGKFSDMIIDCAAINALTAYSKTKNSGLLGEICAFIADTANIKIALRCAITSQDGDFIKEAIGECTHLDKERLIEAASLGVDVIKAYTDATAYAKGVEIYLKNASDYEKWCDDTAFEIASSAVYTSFGFDPVVSYFYNKSLEIKTVRMILTAIKSGVDKNIIKERLRAHYA